MEAYTATSPMWSPAETVLRRSRLRPVPPQVASPTGMSLLAVDAAMEQAVPERERDLARSHAVVPVLQLAKGQLDLSHTPQLRRPFGAIVLAGVVIRSTTLAGRAAAEVLGPVDLIALGADASDPGTTYTAHTPVTLAILDDRFRVAARRWPGLHDVVYAAMARQLQVAADHGALLHLSRVEDRLVALFARLATRWGRVTPAGVAISVRLSHQLVGELVGARRPTVSLALTQLAAAGTLQRRDDGVWLLRHDQLAA